MAFFKQSDSIKIPAHGMVVNRTFINKKTVGIRVPDNLICKTIIEALGNPIITTSLHNMEDDILDYYTDPEVIHDQYEKKVDIVIDGGLGNLYASTVLDCSENDDIVVIREGLGSLAILD